MNGEQLIQLERHEMLRDAHAIIVQWIKYPETVAASAVAEARSRIEAHRLLSSMAAKPARQE
jgi:hypothetical protein